MENWQNTYPSFFSNEWKLEEEISLNQVFLRFGKRVVADPGILTALESKVAQLETFRNRPRTIADAQDMTGFTDSTIRHAINRGELPATRDGGKILLKAADVKAWQARRAAASRGRPAFGAHPV